MNSKALKFSVILLSLAALLSSCSDYRVSPDQSEYFTKFYGGPGEDNGQTIRNTPDGGYIIAGTVENTTLGHSQAYIAKLDSKGDLQWQKTLGDTTTFGTSVNLVSTGGYILCGYVMNSTDSDIVLYKFDNGGGLVAENIYSLPGNQIANDIIEIPSGPLVGDFFIVGSSVSRAIWFSADANLTNSIDLRGGTEAISLKRVITDGSLFYSIGDLDANRVYLQKIRMDIEELDSDGKAIGEIDISGQTKGFDVVDSKNGTLYWLATNIVGGESDMVVFVTYKSTISNPARNPIRILDQKDITGRSIILDGSSLVVGGTISSDIGDPQMMFMKFDTTTTYIPESITDIGGGETENGSHLAKASDGGYVQIGDASSDEGNTIISVIKVKSDGTQKP